MTIRFYYKKSVTILFLIVIAIFLAACSSDEQKLQDDPTASASIARLNAALSSGQKLSVEEFAALKEIIQKFPASETVRKTYKSALIRREDWAALEAFISEMPFDELSPEDKINLGKAYYKLGRYSDAAKALENVPGNAETNAVLAGSYFHSGNYAAAKRLIDADWERIRSQKAVEEITLRGLIYFHENEMEKAIETLSLALETKPDNIPAANALSRIYAARGDEKKAEEYLKKVQQTFDSVTAEERRKTVEVENIYKLQDAFKAKRFDEVITLANKLLPEANSQNKLALYQFLYNSYTALGKTDEAQEALNNIRRLQQQR